MTQPDKFDWATELSDAQGHVTLSEQEAHEIGARLRRQHTENEALQAGYAAARLEIESLQSRIKTMAEEHADELMVAHLDGRMRAEQPAGAQQPTTQPAPQQETQEPVWDGKLSAATRKVLNDLYLQCGHDAVTIDLLNERVAYLERKLKEADSVLEDAARLDWLALAGPTSICVVIDREHDGEVEVSTDDVTGYGKTLREALDAARKQGAHND